MDLRNLIRIKRDFNLLVIETSLISLNPYGLGYKRTSPKMDAHYFLLVIGFSTKLVSEMSLKGIILTFKKLCTYFLTIIQKFSKSGLKTIFIKFR